MAKIKRAIILAAGRGKRLRPLTNDTPKPLLKINDKPIIEYVIDALKQNSIDDITIVTGYRSGQFKYLIQKYGVTIRRNKDFNHGSNLLSLKIAIDKIDDCVILDGDLILSSKAIRSEVDGSGYSYVHDDCANEWQMFVKDGKIERIVPDLTEKHDFDALHSISYWVEPQASLLRQALANAKDDVNYYDDIAIQMPNLLAFEMKHEDFLEIDTVEDYENAKRIMEKA